MHVENVSNGSEVRLKSLGRLVRKPKKVKRPGRRLGGRMVLKTASQNRRFLPV
jgi:hypothetical protein